MEISDKNPKPKKIIERRPNGTLRVQTATQGASRTQQQFKDDCDVNRIMAKYKATGTLTHVKNAQNGVYVDLINLPSFQESLSTVLQAERAFEEVPAKIRARFQNDPHQFIQFLADPSNDDEAVKLGLIARPQPKQEDPVLSALQKIESNTKSKREKIEKQES